MNNTMEYKGFVGSVLYSDQDECFAGKILGINDLVTFEGDSVKELKQSFHEAVEDYLLMCEKAGREPEKSYKGCFNVRIDPVLHQKASILAESENISLNKFVEISIADRINMHQAK